VLVSKKYIKLEQMSIVDDFLTDLFEEISQMHNIVILPLPNLVNQWYE